MRKVKIKIGKKVYDSIKNKAKVNYKYWTDQEKSHLSNQVKTKVSDNPTPPPGVIDPWEVHYTGECVGGGIVHLKDANPNNTVPGSTEVIHKVYDGKKDILEVTHEGNEFHVTPELPIEKANLEITLGTANPIEVAIDPGAFQKVYDEEGNFKYYKYIVTPGTYSPDDRIKEIHEHRWYHLQVIMGTVPQSYVIEYRELGTGHVLREPAGGSANVGEKIFAGDWAKDEGGILKSSMDTACRPGEAYYKYVESSSQQITISIRPEDNKIILYYRVCDAKVIVHHYIEREAPEGSGTYEPTDTKIAEDQLIEGTQGEAFTTSIVDLDDIDYEYGGNHTISPEGLTNITDGGDTVSGIKKEFLIEITYYYRLRKVQ